MACIHTCGADGDCTVMGMDIGLVCQDTHCVDPDPPPPCTDDASCIPVGSGWAFQPCTMGGGECAAAMGICVDLGDGTGGCATQPSEFFMCSSIPGFEDSEQTDLDTGMPVTVCANLSYSCNTDLGVCYDPCEDDTSCSAAGLVCDTDSGFCVCDGDDDCAAFDGGACVDGVCDYPGCTDDSECMNTFDGGTVACQ
jgi:hypothetical protein